LPAEEFGEPCGGGLRRIELSGGKAGSAYWQLRKALNFFGP
jgi:hypothetical protein